MKQQEIEALLGRPLTSVELTNIGSCQSNLHTAIESLESLLCTSMLPEIDEARIFNGREGYRSVFIGIFNNVTEVKVDGEVIEPSKYHASQWDNRNGEWFNSIVFNDRLTCSSEIEVTADWGFVKVPSDLTKLVAKLFADLSKKYVSGSGKVHSKKVEDFTITYVTGISDDEQFIAENKRTLAKYSLCNVGDVRHGRIRCF